MTDFDPQRPLSLTKPLTPMPPTVPGAQTMRSDLAPGPYQQPVPAPMPVMTTTVVQRSNVEIIIAWIVAVITGLYMLPWAIAATRRSTNSIVIAIATFFLAWTIVGWFVMLVLSFLGPTVYTVTTQVVVAPVPLPVAAAPVGSWAYCAGDPPNVRRWWDGRAWTGYTHVV